MSSSSASGRTVGDVAAMAGVSVRTLHHYDEIGLLRPSVRDRAGYRRYTDADVARLQQVLLYRQLGFELADIGRLLDDPDTDPTTHLRRQHRLLGEQVSRLQAMQAAVALTLEAIEMDIELTAEERLEVFGDYPLEEHAAEAEQRWGETDAFRESRRRTASYGMADWQRITTEAADIEHRLAAAHAAGAAPGGQEAMDVAEAHRRHIGRWFYDCSPEMHRALASMWVDDERFRAHYERIAPGLAVFARDAATANADRLSG